MKATKLLTLMSILALVPVCGMAQQEKKIKAELNDKVSIAAQEEAELLKKEGWRPAPGALPLEKQLDRSYMFQLMTDDNMEDVYIDGNGKSVGVVYDATKQEAIEVARLELASKIGSECAGLIDVLLANKQLPQNEANSIATVMSENKTIFAQKLGKLKTVVEAWRELPNKDKEVMIRLFAKSADIQAIAKSFLRDELERRGIKLTGEMTALLSTTK